MSRILRTQLLSNSITVRTLVLSTLLAFAWAISGTSATSAATHPLGGSISQSRPQVVKRAVTFQVRNVNGSTLPCASDGASYEVKGHLIGPASKLGPGAP